MIQIDGDKRLIDTMQRLRRTAVNRIIRTVTRAECKDMAAEAKSKAPSKSGLLKRSIKVRSMKRSTVKVGSRVVVYFPAAKRQANAFYGGFQEWGFVTRNGRKIAGKQFLKSVATRNVIDDTQRQIANQIQQEWNK